MSLTGLLLLAAALGDLVERPERGADVAEEVRARDREEDPDVVVTLRLTGNGRFGGSIGNVLLVPFAVPGPAAGGELSGQLVLYRHFTLGADVAGSFGLATDRADPLPLAGYRGRVRLGLVTDIDRLVLAGDLHAGVSSVSLLPLPRVGVGGSVAWRFVDDEHFIWDLRGDLDLDLVIIAPAPGAGLSTGATFRFETLEVGARIGIEADAVFAIVVNSIGAAASLDVFAGGRF